jgi:hypothetical protein
MAEFLCDLFFEIAGAFVEMGIEDAVAQNHARRRDKVSRGLGTI